MRIQEDGNEYWQGMIAIDTCPQKSEAMFWLSSTRW